MENLRDSSEIKEAARLFSALLTGSAHKQAAKREAPRPTAPLRPIPRPAQPEIAKPAQGIEAPRHATVIEKPTPIAEAPKHATVIERPTPVVEAPKHATVIEKPTPVAEAPRHAHAPVAETPSRSSGTSRGEQLDNILVLMCKRSGFAGAVIADESGLPLAVHNSPVDDAALAAFTSVLGDALNKASVLLRKRESNNISMDISYEEKVVLMRFEARSLPYYLMVIGWQELDLRSEMEISIDKIISVLR